MLTKIKRPITLYCSTGKHVSTSLTGISLEKIGIVWDQPIKKGVNLGVKFTLPIENHIYEFKAGVVVTHSHLQTDKYYTLFKITSLPEQYKVQLKRFLQSRGPHSADAA